MKKLSQFWFRENKNVIVHDEFLLFCSMKRSVLIHSLLIFLLTVTLFGCSASKKDEAEEIVATLNEWSLTLSKTETSSKKIRFRVKNEGKFIHSFAIEGVAGQTKMLNPGEEQELIFTAEKEGTYTVFCPLPGHKMKGQVNTLVVK
jgi:hypothetical protein